MGQEKKNEYAGDLLEEIQEMDKIICEDMDFNVNSTQTRRCMTILTIYCC